MFTLQYDKAINLLADTPFTRTLIGQYIDVFDYPGAVSRSVLTAPPCPVCAMTGCPKWISATVESKRLNHALQVADLLQQQRDNRVVIRRQRGRI